MWKLYTTSGQQTVWAKGEDVFCVQAQLRRKGKCGYTMRGEKMGLVKSA